METTIINLPKFEEPMSTFLLLKCLPLPDEHLFIRGKKHTLKTKR